MKLTNLRVTNFRCIEDTTEFQIDQVTCLVGKNEAGKSALLEALYKLNPVDDSDPGFIDEDYPRRHISAYRDRENKDPARVIESTWRLEDSEKADLESVYGRGCLGSDVVKISKGYDNQIKFEAQFDEDVVVEHLIARSGVSTPDQAPDGFAALEELCDRGDEGFAPLKALVNECSLNGSVYDGILSRIDACLPKFLLFKDYNKLPGRVAVEALLRRREQKKSNFEDRMFIALLDLAKSGVADIQEIDRSERLIMELEAVQNRLTEEIFEYWSQNSHLEVQFRFDQAKSGDPAPFNSGNVFSTRIRNGRHRVTVGFDERSSGFVWFFSFLVWFSQVKNTYGSNIMILLDEPGLTLHGKAQKDLLRYFEERLRPNHQVMYSTHSPFMIDVKHIFSVRTVEDVVFEDRILGTKVGDKILSRDKDTLLPLQGIAGYDIAQTMFVGPYVLVVEGPSEAGYINWFSRYLVQEGRSGLDLRWAVAPAEGAPKVSSFVTLFSGRGLRIAALLDYHDGQKRMVDDLEKSGLLGDGALKRTTDYVSQNEADIEDVLGRELYVALVNEAYGLPTPNLLPDSRAANAPERVVKEVAAHFRTLPVGIPEFDHYAPVSHLMQMDIQDVFAFPGFSDAVGRFERLFEDLNKLISN